MSKVLVVSDSHGDQKILRTIWTKFNDQVECFFHCGDSELSKDSDLIHKYLLVKGNMDFEDFPIERTISVGDTKVYQTHGHLKGVNFNILNLLLTAESMDAGIALFGHTHELMCTTDNGVLLVNPGSISQPRGDFASIGGTFCTIDINNSDFIVDYYNREMQVVPELHFQFKRHDDKGV
ncbi:YfcE family phosphodiesterase [Lentilactobacillus kosonis]|uniref:Phosphoesterase n=1 Tax=Lentilactobacillus kosonis TaxID=2810561 RepID=A0A401FLA9_9LACO|nr:metallophosphoesterase [Lentilactobacillus kosonis]GAY73174.1 phosphoesterase [Lentilactobacillus kosonis]